MSSMRRIFSGIQPTGAPHIGNYLGAIKNWVKLQKTAQKRNEVMFCVVDLHSCTVPHNQNTLRENIFNMVASLLACGLDQNKSLIFQQSQVPHHAELSWFLACMTSTSHLQRMHHWKSKKNLNKDNNLGLFSYPVLMAADVLLYQSTHVPVGHDQVQHMELTRDLAETFNKQYAMNLPIPQTILTPTPRVMGLQSPKDKMSKSSGKVNSRIDITDSPETIVKKIQKAVTDSEPYISRDLSNRPGVLNLIEILAECSETPVEQIIQRYEGVQYFTRDLKRDVTEAVTEELKPIRINYERLKGDRAYLQSVLCEGSKEANTIAANTMNEIYTKIGMR